MKKNYVLLIALLFWSAFTFSQTDSPLSTPENAIVQTDYGKVRGYLHNTIFTYKGVPYAQADRFMPPQKPKSWPGVRNSMAYGPVCPQTDSYGGDEAEFAFQHDFGFQKEDCQRLNIWSPGVNDSKKRPVMVWLHGGGFATGSCQELPSYDGENLSKKGDVVVVSLNHRLNVLGYLNLSGFGEKYKHSGNVGMLDIVTALEWVKNNISQFGGDANNITIFGQSGGGGKVSTLLGMPTAKGLFHKAIIQSGSRPYILENKHSKLVGQAILEELNLQPTQVDSLQKLPYETLITAANMALKKLNQKLSPEEKSYMYGSSVTWGPCLEEGLIPFQPISEEALSVNPNIPLMMGSNKNEGNSFANANNNGPKTMEEAKKNLEFTYKDKTDSYIEALRKAYPEANLPIDLMYLDNGYRHRTVQLANHRSKVGPVYTYLFTWKTPTLDGRFLSFHCLELPFVFNNVDRCPEVTGGTPEAQILGAKMSQAWFTFSRTGNPNHKGLPDWKPYTQENGVTMIFNNKCETKMHHDEALLKIVSAK